MSHQEPGWNFDGVNSRGSELPVDHPCFEFNAASIPPDGDFPLLPLDMTEMTWEDGQLAMALAEYQRMQMENAGIIPQPDMSMPWDNPPDSGTLQEIVNRATLLPQPSAPTLSFEEQAPGLVAGSYTQVEPSSELAGDFLGSEGGDFLGKYFGMKTAGVTDTSGTCGWECNGQRSLEDLPQEKEISGEPSKMVAGGGSDDRSRLQKQSEEGEEKKKKKGKGKLAIASASARKRANDVHKLSERNRRERINDNINTLQKMVPNANKTDKASKLEEVIQYTKQLQAHMAMVNRMVARMTPAEQQQLQMSAMKLTGMTLNMATHNLVGMPHQPQLTLPLHPPPLQLPSLPPLLPKNQFMPMPQCDVLLDGAGYNVDPAYASFLACPPQVGASSAYNGIPTMYQPVQQLPPASTSGGPNNGVFYM